MDAPDSVRLIERASRGDAEAVSALYQMYAQAIYRYVAYRVGNDGDAEDLTAEVFLKMVEALPSYQPSGAPFEAWLYRIASARVVDYYRRHGRRPVVELTEQLPGTGPLMEERLHRQQEAAELREALAQLSPEHQNVLILRFVENRSHKEVAALLGKSEAAVRMIQHRALTQLAEALGSDSKARHYLRGNDD